MAEKSGLRWRPRVKRHCRKLNGEVLPVRRAVSVRLLQHGSEQRQERRHDASLSCLGVCGHLNANAKRLSVLRRTRSAMWHWQALYSRTNLKLAARPAARGSAQPSPRPDSLHLKLRRRGPPNADSERRRNATSVVNHRKTENMVRRKGNVLKRGRAPTCLWTVFLRRIR